jgi:hypothetical protein
MEFGETLLEFSKGIFFHNVLDGFFFSAPHSQEGFSRMFQ